MKLLCKDEFGWHIGKWNTPISMRWIKLKILRYYGIKFDEKFNTICLGRFEIRIWKPQFLRPGYGMYFFRKMPNNKNNNI